MSLMSVAVMAGLLVQAGKPAVTPVPAKTAAADRLGTGNYRLQAHGNGGYRWRGPVFTAVITRDGTVTFEDHRPLPAQVAVPVVAVAKAASRPDPRKGEPPRERGKGLLGIVADAAKQIVTQPTLAISDAEIFRDSHHAAKMDFLEQTGELRRKLHATEDEREEKAGLGGLRRHIQQVANDESLSLPARRRVIYLLWRECEDSAAGRRARTIIESEALRQFPPHTPRAYSQDELAKLNAGETPAFAPAPVGADPAK